MTKQKIHIFNPETDYALAAGDSHYNPPASIIKLRKSMALFPATYADNGDVIILLDKFSTGELETMPHADKAREKGINIIPLDEIETLEGICKPEMAELSPWGWNHSLRRTLISAGIPETLLKPEAEINRLRELSHRRTTLPFRSLLANDLPHMTIDSVREVRSVEEAQEFLAEHGMAYFKAPWSSSGRGVVCSTGMPEEKLAQWIGGTIKRQGSVMAEAGRERAGDFATEWICREGKADFLGLSFFNTTSDGHYKGNLYAPQEEISGRILALSNEWDFRIVEAQKKALEEVIAPGYDGPVGIDMLADTEGHINPCVEINLRMTMGLAAFLTTAGQK